MRRFAQFLFAGILTAGLLASEACAQETFAFANEPIRDVLADIEARSELSFLYRDALIAGRRVSFAADAEHVLAGLEAVLAPYNLRLRVNADRNQVLLIEGEAQSGRAAHTVRGVVLDDDRGTRLPFAAVTWIRNGRRTGTAADESGTFTLDLGSGEELDVTVSYIGYASRTVHVAATRDRLPVRLRPETAYAPEVVVTTAALQSEVDTTWRHLLEAGTFAPLGEGGIVRALQLLPSVSLTSAASSGLNVRGSRADGFQVLLDGMSMYSQSHFFGLFDAFNEDVLQAVGLYYGVAPASLQGPPGGTLSFVTRTGSQTGIGGTLGISSTSTRGTLEGPVLGGRGSWLIAGRASHLNAFPWLRNDELIGLGLDVGRESDVPTGPVREVPVSAVTAGNATARFYDAHAKLFYEARHGARLTVSGYLGGDESLHDAERLADDDRVRDPILIPADTRNDWGNAAASAQFQTPLGSRMVARTTAGFSRYRSEFSKDDFVYADPITPAAIDTGRHVIRPFANSNELSETKLSQEIDIAGPSLSTWSFGLALQRYVMVYGEESILRSNFDGRRRSTQADAYAQLETRPTAQLNLLAGVRTHYFTFGRFFRLSPRLRIRLFPDAPVSLGAGYSRNHQFIHRLYVEQSTHADIWVMSAPNQPPAEVDHLTAGIYARPTSSTSFQIEAYRKDFTNMREHEASAARRRLQRDAPASLLLDPWLHDNTGRARGIEVMLSRRVGSATWTSSYTLSRMELRNPRVNGGDPFPADWDRRHQFTSHVRIELLSGLTAHVAWAYATGTPNALALADPREPERLSAYHRMDAGIRLQRRLGAGFLEMALSAYNLFDRSNTWYRRPVPVVRRTPDGRRVSLQNVDVYDLGFRPSFDVSYRL